MLKGLLICLSSVKLLRHHGVSKLLNFYCGVSKLSCSCSQLSASCLSRCHLLFFSFSPSTSPFLPHSPSGPLLWPINRSVGGDGEPQRETEHFGWFPEKGNDRPRQYPALHLLRTPSALLTRLEANTQRTQTVSSQVIQLMSRWMAWDVLITWPNFFPLVPDQWLCLLRAKKCLK